MMVQKSASLHEKAVQKVAKGHTISTKKGRSAPTRRTGPVKTTTVHPLLRKWLKAHGLRVQDVKVLDPESAILPTDRRFK